MSKNSKIEWTHHTWNPWRGCAHAVLTDGRTHPGCDHCYAERMAKRNTQVLGVWGALDAGGTRVLAAPQTFYAPLAWNDKAAAAGARQRVFLDSMHDLFEDWPGEIVDHQGNVVCQRGAVPQDASHWRSFAPGLDPAGWSPITMNDVRREVFRVIDQCPWLDFLILTKRPGNVLRMFRAVTIQSQQQADDRNERGELFRRNVWLGTSISDQPTADELVPELLRSRALSPVLFVSAEPLLGLVDLTLDGLGCGPCRWCEDQAPDPETNVVECRQCDSTGKGDELLLDWVIVGGESGPNARPLQPQWARDLRDQCVAAGVPFFFKQWGAWLPETIPGTHADLEQLAANQQVAYGDGATNHVRFTRVGKTAAGRLLDGREWNEFPGVPAVTHGSGA